jgi:hypothetical protein
MTCSPAAGVRVPMTFAGDAAVRGFDESGLCALLDND